MILKEHLHTQKCIPLIREYQKCHKEHPIQKFFGICNQIEARMKICFNEELKMRARMNKRMKGPARPNKIEREVGEDEVN